MTVIFTVEEYKRACTERGTTAVIAMADIVIVGDLVVKNRNGGI